MPAELEVHNCMNLAGRGAVLLAFVRSGTPQAGQVTEPLTLAGVVHPGLEILAVEKLSSMGTSRPAVGLVFREPPRLDALRAALPPGTLLVLEGT